MVGVMRDDSTPTAEPQADRGAQRSGGGGGDTTLPSVPQAGGSSTSAPPQYDEGSLYDDKGRLVCNIDMFRDDNFVQDKIMPLKHVPVLTPRSEESLRRQGLIVEEIMPHFGPAYAVDASK